MENNISERDVAEFAESFPLSEALRDKSIAITGATGLLGACMVRCLLALNKYRELHLRVLAVIRNREKAVEILGNECKELGFYCYDFARNEAFAPDERIDYLLHFAAPTASRSFVDQPVEVMNTVYDGMRNILSYARGHRLKSIVLASTLEVYGTITDDSRPLTESDQGYLDPMAARSSYPLAKRAAEGLCHNYAAEYGVPVKVARLAQTFGAGVSKTDNRVFAQFARSIVNGTDIILHTAGELSRCYCYTTDAISAMLYILMKGEDGEAYNVANETTYISIRKMAQYLSETFNPAVRVVVDLQDGLGYSPTTKLRLDTGRIRSLGWEPRYGMKEMFARLIASLKEE